MKYDNLTLVRPLIGQSSPTLASDWTDEHWSAAFPWVSHELLFTDLRYLVAILRLSGLIARNYRTLALVRFDDIPPHHKAEITTIRVSTCPGNTGSGHPGAGDLTSHTRVYSFRGGWHLGQSFFCSNKICGFCLKPSFFTQDILRMTGGLLFREKRKKNWKQEAVREH